MNKNTKNALCTLAVIAAFIFLLGMVRSEGFWGGKAKTEKKTKVNGQRCKKRSDGFLECMRPRWKTIKHAKHGISTGNIGVETEAKNFGFCAKKCMDNPECDGFVHFKDQQMCKYKSKDQMKQGNSSLMERDNVNIYTKFNTPPVSRARLSAKTSSMTQVDTTVSRNLTRDQKACVGVMKKIETDCPKECMNSINIFDRECKKLTQ